MALMLLTFGLAGCGGDEPAAVVTPPAPPPAPPPFVPQAVEVALGTSGQTLTLMTTESGGYTFNGEAFATGTDISADNGSTYTLTLDGTTWSAAYKMPEAMSLALGISGENISIQRLEDGSYQFGDGMALTSGMVVTAGNGNMYTVTLGDDGAFAAEYVRPAAQSIPLGASGTSIEVRMNEDGSYSYLDGGQWLVITADSRMSAANGNVYGPLLAPDGRTPVGVMHVAAMQDVTLGALGGTLQLTQAEDMTWWLGDMQVMSGYVHTANGNRYVLTLDAAGMWSAVYQQNMVTVALGTQGSVSLAQAEDMSWWLGTEAVESGRVEVADNGNEYVLTYADGAWAAQFRPMSMEIAGTGLTAMTREADDMYDVGGDTLPSSGIGDVSDGDAMYHVWMAASGLAGARFDARINGKTDYATNGLEIPFLSSDDPDTPGNESQTHLVATGTDDTGRGMFSLGDLLGSGRASNAGMRFVAEAVEEIEKVQERVSAVLGLDPKLSTLDAYLDTQWGSLKEALDPVFNTTSTASNNATSAVRATAPGEEDILDDISDILAALSSESRFVAATAEDGGGVFESRELDADKAAAAFKRVRWSAAATLGSTGSTRYGTAARKVANHAQQGPNLARGEYGAFSYSTMEETVRTADAAAVSPTGIARYSGGTRAVSGSGTAYAGLMDLQVRFNVNMVSGVVTDLQDADGKPWQHNFADVSQIVLGDERLLRNATWGTNALGADGTVFYTRDSGILRPVSSVANTFRGILLGRGADAGSEANGTWEVGNRDSAGYLTGGFGVLHVADEARPAPSTDSGAEAGAKLLTTRPGVDRENDIAKAEIKDGMLTVTGRKYGWAPRAEGQDVRVYTHLSTDDEATEITAQFDLEELAASGEGEFEGPKWVDGVIAILTRERDLLTALQGLKSSDTQAAETAAWVRVQDALEFNLFGANERLPAKFDVNYTPDNDADTADLESEAEAIELINLALDALSSNAKLEAALRPDRTGIFSHYNTGTADDADTPDIREDRGAYIKYDEGQRRWEFFNAATTATERTIGNARGEREYKVIAAMGTTNYTRFGMWRREDTSSARRNDGTVGNVIRTRGGPGTFAYSPLDATPAGTPANTSFPQGGSAVYTGETVALQNTKVLTGTVRVDVAWGADADSGTLGTFNASGVGTMALTISDLASADGDPLSQGGNDSTIGNEIADIVFPGISILVGGKGDFAGNLIAGTANTTDPQKVTYSEALVENGRYRLVNGVNDVPVAGTDSVQALFVGRGVDGPLGVIGTWTLTDSTVGRVAPTGDHTDNLGSSIYGAFGAEVP